MLYLASEDFLCLHFTVDQLRDMIWKAEEYMAVKIVILILSIFVYFANVLLFLLQLQVFIIIQALVDGFSSFQMVLARFRQSQVVLACFNSFLTLISTKKNMSSLSSYTIYSAFAIQRLDIQHCIQIRLNFGTRREHLAIRF